MNAFETYVSYLAMKAHFTQKNYDYIKYNGKIRANVKSFETRRDKYAFEKLSKMDDVETRILSNFLVNPKTWIGNIISSEGQTIYKQHIKKTQSLTRLFTLEIKKLKNDFNSNFIVEDGQWPFIVRLCKSKEISIETLIIINDIINVFPYWNKEIEDTIIWPIMYNQVTKYSPFLQKDKKKFKKILKDYFSLYK